MKKRKKQNNWHFFIVCSAILIIGIFTFNIYQFSQIKNLQNPHSSQEMMGQPMSRMSFSEFDKSMAKQFMDKDGDGKCDACGMPIDQCIASGMMQCSMEKNAKIGLLGSQHVHADWKIYVGGKPLDLSSYSHMQRMNEGKSVSSFIHVDSGAPAPEKTGDVLHMHAKGVPLSMFFESVGMNFSKECIELSNTKYCSSGNKSLKMFVNGKENNEFENYVFIDLDKILITYGTGNVEEQLESITSFADDH